MSGREYRSSNDDKKHKMMKIQTKLVTEKEKLTIRVLTKAPSKHVA